MDLSLTDQVAVLGVNPDGTRFLVAWSGGRDSTCLLHACVAEGLDVVAAHLDHQQRSGSEEEQARLGAIAESWGVPFLPGRANVPLMAEQGKMGLEEAGRLARQNFLERARIGTDCQWILTGHTLDDQVETILFRLARGTGLRGLGGIPARRDPYLRPLLKARRSETVSYCEQLGVELVEDESNSDLTFSRARIRARVRPELSLVNPAADEHIAALAELVGEEDRFLDGMAAAAMERCEISLNAHLRFLTDDCEVALGAPAFRAEPLVLQKRGIRLVLATLGAQPEAHHIETILREGTGSITTPLPSVVVKWDQDRLHFSVKSVDEPYRQSVPVPGELEAQGFGWTLTISHGSGAFPRDPNRLTTGVAKSKVQGEIYLRPFGTGDKMCPLGAPGRRLLSDILSEMHLTEAAKRRLPILCDMVGPVWVPGGPIEDRVKIEDGEPFWLCRLAPNDRQNEGS
ncbi:MAG: tRNA lysidine(34) synthetase TilS [Fimbriimonadaceae bacterium]|nr:tRNA lysidine(34) synthetase TilS [Fimbriimonadaceae bacterium]